MFHLNLPISKAKMPCIRSGRTVSWFIARFCKISFIFKGLCATLFRVANIEKNACVLQVYGPFLPVGSILSYIDQNGHGMPIGSSVSNSKFHFI